MLSSRNKRNLLLTVEYVNFLHGIIIKSLLLTYRLPVKCQTIYFTFKHLVHMSSYEIYIHLYSPVGRSIHNMTISDIVLCETKKNCQPYCRNNSVDSIPIIDFGNFTLPRQGCKILRWTGVSQKPRFFTPPNYRRVLPMAVARSASHDSVIHYVLPVLWMTSCLRLCTHLGMGDADSACAHHGQHQVSDVYDCLVCCLWS